MKNTVLMDPVHHRFAVAVPPKNGTTAVFHWLHIVAHGRAYAGDYSIYHWGKKVECDGAAVGSIPRVAVHRDQTERVLSYFKNRYAETWSFDDWIATIDYRMERDGHARYHLRPQSATLGTEPDWYDIVLPTSRLGEIPTILGKLIGHELPEIQRMNRSDDFDVPMSEKSRTLLEGLAAYDRAAGWDGVQFSLAKPRTNP